MFGSLRTLLGFATSGRPPPMSQCASSCSSSHEGVPEVFRLDHLNGVCLHEATVQQLQKYMEKGSFSAVEYTNFVLERIRAVNQYLEAVIETNPDALDIASQLDQERVNGHFRGPLHGIPILVEDNMATNDKMQTTAGSWALLGSLVPRDAHTVSLIRKAGAVIIGHANMTEWAGVRSRIYSSGYSPRGGQVRNPFNLSKSPCMPYECYVHPFNMFLGYGLIVVSPDGSSGGSAVAVSANVVPVSFGTETDTSIIGPAMINGIVGIKPTVGLTSRSGVVPISETQDSIGPFGRTVADAVVGLDAMVGADERDPLTLVPERNQEKSYASFITDRGALRGARFGLPHKRCWELVPEDHKALASRLFDAIKSAGAEIVPVDFPSAEDRIAEDGQWDWELGEPSKSEITVNKIEAYYTMNSFLSELKGTEIKTVEDVLTFNEVNTGTEGATPGVHPAYQSGQDLLQDVARTKGIKDDIYYSALNHIRKATREQGIDAALKYTIQDGQTIELDVLLLCDRNSVGQQYAAQAGYPVICIPIGLDDEGLPVSLNLQHSAWKEGILIKWASAIEDLIRAEIGSRPTPTYKMHTAKNIPVEGAM